MKKICSAACAALVLLSACQQPQAEKTIVVAANAPAAIGPYSQGVRIGNRLYLSGQLGLEPQSGDFVAGGVAEQSRQALENQRAVLAEAGFAFSDVVSCQVFLINMDDYAAFNAVYADYFPANPPARAVVQVGRLPKNGLVEIMMVAEK
ncbi:MAG TPA: Rid family detoxifying hydrolase [bacterium]|jgi:2-iminobutanoate/2-iminopropanoate deaminase|nr:Rid family detoxifying hydrolase [bacterium]HNT65425.1 Rid family detoxifying hydrolase [bacterium]HOX87117.1 Rid family detoxifying hydrolase [bacterium]HPG46448.1 Rid family detoxifying hydrolase [bacterium]HPM98639.1 Rid family detoxifying hydrolase [bacterium]